MRFIQTHSTGSDETAPYDIEDYKAKTVVEFINEMLEERPHEWGNISVLCGNGYLTNHISYKDGQLQQEIPNEWQYKHIVKVDASGGWSRMDYRIFVKL